MEGKSKNISPDFYLGFDSSGATLIFIILAL